LLSPIEAKFHTSVKKRSALSGSAKPRSTLRSARTLALLMAI
jgi:hypothetical protein